MPSSHLSNTVLSSQPWLHGLLVSSWPPRVSLPLSSVVCHPPSFSTCPVHCSLLLSSSYASRPFPYLHHDHAFFSYLLSLLWLFFVPSCFCTLAAFVVVSVFAKVSVPYRHAGVTQVLTVMGSHDIALVFWRSAITHLNCSPCVRSGLCSSALSPSSRLRTLPLLGTRNCPLGQFLPLQLNVQLFPLVENVQHFRHI